MPIQRFLKASRIYRQKSLSPNRTAVTSLLTGEPTRVYTGEALGKSSFQIGYSLLCKFCYSLLLTPE